MMRECGMVATILDVPAAECTLAAMSGTPTANTRHPARRFLALPACAPAPWRAWLSALDRALRAVHVADLHLTLVFLGRVDDAALRRAWGALQADPPPSPEGACGRLGWFGHPGSPTTLALELPEHGPLQDWVRRRRAALLDAAGVPPDPRPVRLHVSLARLRRGHARPAADELPPLPDLPLPLRPAECWESVPGSDGRRYRRVDMPPLPG